MLRAHQIIERIAHSRSYQVTADSLTIALFFTRLTQRVPIPGMAELAATARRRHPAAPGRPRLQDRDHRTCPVGIPRCLTGLSGHRIIHVPYQP
jgi:hypothetical protein